MLKLTKRMGIMKKLDTWGFSIVEVILIVVIIGLLGGIGYYVYSSQKKTNTALDSAAKSQGEPQKTEKKTTPVSSTKTDPNTGYVVVKDWNVRFKPGDIAKNTYLGEYSSASQSYNLRNTDLDKWPDCKTSPMSVAAIIRVKGDPIYTEAGADGTKHYSDLFGGKSVNGYYYYIQHAQYLCDGGQDKEGLVANIESALAKSSSTIEQAQ